MLAVDLAVSGRDLPLWVELRFQVDLAQQKQLCISYPSESQHSVVGSFRENYFLNRLALLISNH